MQQRFRFRCASFLARRRVSTIEGRMASTAMQDVSQTSPDGTLDDSLADPADRPTSAFESLLRGADEAMEANRQLAALLEIYQRIEKQPSERALQRLRLSALERIFEPHTAVFIELMRCSGFQEDEGEGLLVLRQGEGAMDHLQRCRRLLAERIDAAKDPCSFTLPDIQEMMRDDRRPPGIQQVDDAPHKGGGTDSLAWADAKERPKKPWERCQ
ncbi:unnamed protein product [Vitrella brassicaformis CCMP3155]|uniref:Uncharacterized protein n=1 Tax=Vitrella brassicaformis (strain CCMP3155) TaxID=1169540 RepID=A0A0G4EB70_VITBC|nr:unnamed protein product [Vitrella brassicaformis CCMP3155]|eukprot:CEL92947.1 unnamed protein product [Vitrella brassicaformis CCMP3155]